MVESSHFRELDHLTQLGEPGAAPGPVPVPLGFPRSRRELFDAREYVDLEERIAAHYRHDIIERIDQRDVVAGPAERI